MALCNKDDAKVLLGRTEADTGDDELIARMCVIASQWIAAECGRYDEVLGVSLLEQFVERVELHGGALPYVDLAGWPIHRTGQTFEVRSADNLAAVAAADLLVENTDWTLRRSRLLHLEYGRNLFTAFTMTGGWLQVKYSGGWTPADLPPEAAPTPGWPEVPQPVRDAAALLAAHLFRNKDFFGSRSFQVGTGTIDQVVKDIHVVDAIGAAINPLKPPARIGIG